MALTYEEQRLQNIRDNQALLLSLGLDAPARPKATPVKKTTPARQPLKKRKSVIVALDDTKQDVSTPRRKLNDGTATLAATATPDSGVRRSGRNSGKAVDYSHNALEKASGSPLSRTRPARKREDSGSDDSDDEANEADGRQRNAARLGKRIHDPRKFGSIPGVEVGRWWATRMEASTDAIHGPPVAGISGNAIEGAYSVALSGGYADDVDLGEAFTYTGCGGRDLKGTKQNPKNLRTAEQTFNQSFENPMNAALKKSAETRKPVRVIRGFKLDSPYAPAEGYRYDGLYVVERAWMGKGLTKGLLVCRYAFKRLTGQPDLIIRDPEAEEEG